jgi:acyl phosphate:glycerol-3-phosphate acyltransferase
VDGVDLPLIGLSLSQALASLAIGYLLGSIPFGLILSRAAGLGDPRQIGSGNIGATNVLRTGSKRTAALTLLFDLLKGTAAVLISAYLWGQPAALVAGLGAFLGHLYPAWLGFRGGKGVATYLGVLLGLFWPAALAFAAIWLASAALTRYSSLSALLASLAMPILFAGLGRWPEAILFGLLTALLYVKHAGNIERLLRGQEARIGQHSA